MLPLGWWLMLIPALTILKEWDCNSESTGRLIWEFAREKPWISPKSKTSHLSLQAASTPNFNIIRTKKHGNFQQYFHAIIHIAGNSSENYRICLIISEYIQESGLSDALLPDVVWASINYQIRKNIYSRTKTSSCSFLASAAVWASRKGRSSRISIYVKINFKRS